MSTTRPPLRVLDLAGSPSAMGAAHGAAHADEIRRYARERIQLVMDGAWSGGPLTRAEVLDIAASMEPAHERFDPTLHEEMAALADAAGISIPEAIITGGFTDFVDTVRAAVGGPLPSSVTEDDCTAVIVPTSRGRAGHAYLAQTWDMHDSATDHVILLRLDPADGPAARVFATTGCLGQIGMNSEGVSVGINNLAATDGRPGVTWPSVVRGMLKTSTAEEALDVLLGADLAGAHSFLILDRHGDGYCVEAMPSARPLEALGSNPLVHTNHTLDPAASAVQVDRDPPLLASSQRRYERAHELLADGDIDAERLFALTRDEEAICQRPKEPYHIESSGGVVMRPATGDFWACWGPPADNEYEHVEALAAPVG